MLRLGGPRLTSHAPQGDSGCPREVRHEELGRRSDGKCREEHRSKCQEEDGPQIELKGGPVGPIGARLKQGRKEQHEGKLWVEFDGRQPGNEGQRHATDDENDGKRYIEPPSEESEPDADSEQSKKDLEKVHVASDAPNVSEKNAE